MNARSKPDRSVAAPKHACIDYQLMLADLIIEGHEDILVEFNGGQKVKLMLADLYGKACLLKENISKTGSFN